MQITKKQLFSYMNAILITLAIVAIAEVPVNAAELKTTIQAYDINNEFQAQDKFFGNRSLELDNNTYDFYVKENNLKSFSIITALSINTSNPPKPQYLILLENPVNPKISQAKFKRKWNDTTPTLYDTYLFGSWLTPSTQTAVRVYDVSYNCTEDSQCHLKLNANITRPFQDKGYFYKITPNRANLKFIVENQTSIYDFNVEQVLNVSGAKRKLFLLNELNKTIFTLNLGDLPNNYYLEIANVSGNMSLIAGTFNNGSCSAPCNWLIDPELNIYENYYELINTPPSKNYANKSYYIHKEGSKSCTLISNLDPNATNTEFACAELSCNGLNFSAQNKTWNNLTYFDGIVNRINITSYINETFNVTFSIGDYDEQLQIYSYCNNTPSPKQIFRHYNETLDLIKINNSEYSLNGLLNNFSNIQNFYLHNKLGSILVNWSDNYDIEIYPDNIYDYSTIDLKTQNNNFAFNWTDAGIGANISLWIYHNNGTFLNILTAQGDSVNLNASLLYQFNWVVIDTTAIITCSTWDFNVRNWRVNMTNLSGAYFDYNETGVVDVNLSDGGNNLSQSNGNYTTTWMPRTATAQFSDFQLNERVNYTHNISMLGQHSNNTIIANVVCGIPPDTPNSNSTATFGLNFSDVLGIIRNVTNYNFTANTTNVTRFEKIKIQSNYSCAGANTTFDIYLQSPISTILSKGYNCIGSTPFNLTNISYDTGGAGILEGLNGLRVVTCQNKSILINWTIQACDYDSINNNLSTFNNATTGSGINFFGNIPQYINITGIPNATYNVSLYIYNSTNLFCIQPPNFQEGIPKAIAGCVVPNATNLTYVFVVTQNRSNPAIAFINNNITFNVTLLSNGTLEQELNPNFTKTAFKTTTNGAILQNATTGGLYTSTNPLTRIWHSWYNITISNMTFNSQANFSLNWTSKNTGTINYNITFKNREIGLQNFSVGVRTTPIYDNEQQSPITFNQSNTNINQTGSIILNTSFQNIQSGSNAITPTNILKYFATANGTRIAKTGCGAGWNVTNVSFSGTCGSVALCQILDDENITITYLTESISGGTTALINFTLGACGSIGNYNISFSWYASEPTGIALDMNQIKSQSRLLNITNNTITAAVLAVTGKVEIQRGYSRQINIGNQTAKINSKKRIVEVQ